MKPRLIVILGPTATGKSACGLELAEKLQSEIISGDSMLVYRGMDIATAKPSAEDLARVPHHLIDILNPTEDFTVVDFTQKADTLIRDINGRGKIPLVVGGTGLYIKALLEGYEFSEAEADNELRAKLFRRAEEEGPEAVHAYLTEINPALAREIHPHNVKRVIRAIEASLGGGGVSKERQKEAPYDALVFGLTAPRELLYERINERVDEMVGQGIFAETERLLEAGLPENAKSMLSIGYRQILAYRHGEYDKATCIEKIKQATRNFAKRQFTWYRQMEYVRWFDVSEEKKDSIVNKMITEIGIWINRSVKND